jgi:hypothetical protein
MEGQLMRSLLGDDDMMMLEAFMGTGVYGGNPFQQQNNNSSVVAATAAAAPATRQEEQDLVEIGGETALQQILQSLVDNRPENWTYVIFWQLSSTATGDTCHHPFAPSPDSHTRFVYFTDQCRNLTQKTMYRLVCSNDILFSQRIAASVLLHLPLLKI